MTEDVLSTLARNDLRETSDYISNHLQNRKAARTFLDRVRSAISQLRDFPESGTPIMSGKQESFYRYLVCGSYMIFYHLADEKIYVDRILYGRRDYLALLFGDALEEDSSI